MGLAMGAAPAFAKEHSGTSGCFNWSWEDGSWTWTVYWHNTCSDTRKLSIVLDDNRRFFKEVKGGVKGNDWWGTKPYAIYDRGPVD